MQTFLPYPDFHKSAECLDRQRLGKQRLEVRQLLNALENGGGWSNHPAARMWRGYSRALEIYGAAVVSEWCKRGYNNSLYFKIYGPGDFEYPPWFGLEEFHASHRSNLLRKMPEHYSQFGWQESTDLPYYWP